LASDYTKLQTCDIEDMVGSAAYIKFVNACYGISYSTPVTVPDSLEGKTLSFVEKEMDKLSLSRKFNHYTLSECLIRIPDVFSDEGIKDALDRFEKLFRNVNSLL
jgi:hypothetical protein